MHKMEKKKKTEANSNVENETSEAKSKNRFRRCKYALAAESLVLRSFLVWKHGPEIRTNAVIYWFMLPLCVYLQCVPAPLPSYTPRQLACVNLPLTEANQFCLGFFFLSEILNLQENRSISDAQVFTAEC